MTILDKVQTSFTNVRRGEEFSRSEIIQLVLAKFDVNKGSIIPSDYCYNLVNLDKLNNPLLLEFNLFEYIEPSRYKYLGRNQKYSGQILHKINAIYKEVGRWTNGVRKLDPSVAHAAPTAKPMREKNPQSTPSAPAAMSRLEKNPPAGRPQDPTKRRPEPSPKTPLRDSAAQPKPVPIRQLWNSGNRQDWEKALDNYWKAVSSGNLRLERAFDNLDADSIQRMSASQFYDFLHDAYFVWKYTAKNRLATTRHALEKYRREGSMGELARIQKDLFDFDRGDIADGLTIARKIHGLGTAGASGLLSVLFPKEFGTVDQFVVKALCQIEGLPEHAQISHMAPEALTVNDGVLIITLMRQKAIDLNRAFGTKIWTPRMIDQVLWAVGRV